MAARSDKPGQPSEHSLVLQSLFMRIGAHEGTVWLLDDASENLIPEWNSGPSANHFVGKFQQPLTSGLISLVCITGQAICENEVYQHAGQDPRLDQQLGVKTCSMIAVPVRVGGEVLGIVSCVRLKAAGDNIPDPPPFTTDDLRTVIETVESLGSHLTEDL